MSLCHYLTTTTAYFHLQYSWEEHTARGARFYLTCTHTLALPLSTLVSFFPTPPFKYNLRLKIDAVYCCSSYTGILLPSSARISELLVTINNNMKKNTAQLYIFKHQSVKVSLRTFILFFLLYNCISFRLIVTVRTTDSFHLTILLTGK